ncbi:MAG: hypothetical protein HY731_12395 [Candidatus Tectomicrobia bacterium]|nr:hypothetical protein [Candidatus Tectomicrobia bacterium]
MDNFVYPRCEFRNLVFQRARDILFKTIPKSRQFVKIFFSNFGAPEKRKGICSSIKSEMVKTKKAASSAALVKRSKEARELFPLIGFG